MDDNFSILPMATSNCIPPVGKSDSQHLLDAEANQRKRRKNGYNSKGKLWKEGDDGPYTQDRPPPGMIFASYKKDCIGINWKQAVVEEILYSTSAPPNFVSGPFEGQRKAMYYDLDGKQGPGYYSGDKEDNY